MRKTTRRIIVISLLFVFAISAPILIAYSLGYTIDIKKRSIIETGGIFIKSKTSELSIFLNNAFVKKTSLFSGGALLGDIAPGNYLIRIEKENYRPWFKNVYVEPAFVSAFRDIVLLPHTIEQSTATKAEIAFIQKLSEKRNTAVQTPTKATSSPAVVITLSKKNELIQTTGTTTAILASDVNSFHVFDNDTILFINNNGFLARIVPEETQIKTIGRPGFYLAKKPLRFLESSQGDTAILDESGGLFLVDTDDAVHIVGGGINDIAFDGTGEKILARREQNISIIWMEDNTYAPFQKKGTEEIILSIADTKSAIQNAQWFYKDDAHIIIRTNEGVFFTEIDGRGGRNTVELVSGKTDGLFTSPEFPASIFFKKGKTYYKIEI